MIRNKPKINAGQLLNLSEFKKVQVSNNRESAETRKKKGQALAMAGLKELSTPI